MQQSAVFSKKLCYTRTPLPTKQQWDKVNEKLVHSMEHFVRYLVEMNVNVAPYLPCAMSTLESDDMSLWGIKIKSGIAGLSQ